MTDSNVAIHAMDKAGEAAELATTALTKIRSHEEECARRWGNVRWFLGLIYATISAIFIKIFFFA